jgi:O-antigen/teichoic acid export membrane protein
MEYVVLAEIISEIIRLGIFLFLISLKATLLQFIIGGIIASLPGLAIIISLSNKFIKPTFQLDLKLCKYILKESWPLFLTSVFVIIFMRIDQIMLFYMKGTEAVGYYSAAVRIVETLSIIPLAFMTSVFPTPYVRIFQDF